MQLKLTYILKLKEKQMYVMSNLLCHIGFQLNIVISTLVALSKNPSKVGSK